MEKTMKILKNKLLITLLIMLTFSSMAKASDDNRWWIQSAWLVGSLLYQSSTPSTSSTGQINLNEGSVDSLDDLFRSIPPEY
jgi:hypothetical protein